MGLTDGVAAQIKVRELQNEIERLRAALAMPITMQEIRLCSGEGKLPSHTVLESANIILRQRLERINQQLPQKCEECDINYADPPSKLCPGCQAYRDHQR